MDCSTENIKRITFEYLKKQSPPLRRNSMLCSITPSMREHTIKINGGIFQYLNIREV